MLRRSRSRVACQICCSCITFTIFLFSTTFLPTDLLLKETNRFGQKQARKRKKYGSESNASLLRLCWRMTPGIEYGQNDAIFVVLAYRTRGFGTLNRPVSIYSFIRQQSLLIRGFVSLARFQDVFPERSAHSSSNSPSSNANPR